MSHRTKIEFHENNIKKLGGRLCEILVSMKQPYPSFLSFLELQFSSNRYPTAIASLEWCLEKHQPILPESALEVWADIKNNADSSNQLYVLERESDNGYKNPITHMNALMEENDDIPHDFGKRYGLDEGAVKCLWLTSPGFEERFIRKRIREAVERNGSRSGHYIFAKRRYKLTEAESERLVDDIWDNPKTISNVFHKLLNWEKLVRCRLATEHQEEIWQIQADFRA